MELPTASVSAWQALALTTPPENRADRQPAWHCLAHLEIPTTPAAAREMATQVCDLLPPLGLSRTRIEQVAGAVVDAVEHLRCRLAADHTPPALIVNVRHPRPVQPGGWGFFVVEHRAGGAEQPAVELFLYQETRTAPA